MPDDATRHTPLMMQHDIHHLLFQIKLYDSHIVVSLEKCQHREGVIPDRDSNSILSVAGLL